jgi:hypothetical protein
MSYVPSELVEQLKSAKSTGERCFLVSQFYGSETEIRFWTLAIWAANQFVQKHKQNDLFSQQLLEKIEKSASSSSLATIEKKVVNQENVNRNPLKEEVADSPPVLSAPASPVPLQTPNTFSVEYSSTVTQIPDQYDLLMEGSQLKVSILQLNFIQNFRNLKMNVLNFKRRNELLMT